MSSLIEVYAVYTCNRVKVDRDFDQTGWMTVAIYTWHRTLVCDNFLFLLMESLVHVFYPFPHHYSHLEFSLDFQKIEKIHLVTKVSYI